MTRNLIYTTLLLASLTLSACKVGCAIEQKITSGVTGGLVTVLNCKNRAAVEADIKSLTRKMGMCKDPQQQTGFICEQLALLGVKVLGTKLPQRWECTPEDSTTLQAAIGLACSASPI